MCTQNTVEILKSPLKEMRNSLAIPVLKLPQDVMRLHLCDECVLSLCVVPDNSLLEERDGEKGEIEEGNVKVRRVVRLFICEHLS